ADYSGAVFAREGKGVYASTDKGSEFHRLAYVDLTTGKQTALTADVPWDVDDLELASDGKTIAFVTNEDGVSVLRLFDTATGKQKPAPKLGLGPGVISRLQWSPGGQDL